MLWSDLERPSPSLRSEGRAFGSSPAHGSAPAGYDAFMKPEQEAPTEHEPTPDPDEAQRENAETSLDQPSEGSS
jgi:hypothetical protein